jgi:hypothetical protein
MVAHESGKYAPGWVSSVGAAGYQTQDHQFPSVAFVLRVDVVTGGIHPVVSDPANFVRSGWSRKGNFSRPHRLANLYTNMLASQTGCRQLMAGTLTSFSNLVKQYPELPVPGESSLGRLYQCHPDPLEERAAGPPWWKP